MTSGVFHALDPSHIPSFAVRVETGASLEQLIRLQNIAVFHRLLSIQTGHDDAERKRILELLADEQAKETESWQRDTLEKLRAIKATMQAMTINAGNSEHAAAVARA